MMRRQSTATVRATSARCASRVAALAPLWLAASARCQSATADLFNSFDGTPCRVSCETYEDYYSCALTTCRTTSCEGYCEISVLFVLNMTLFLVLVLIALRCVCMAFGPKPEPQRPMLTMPVAGQEEASRAEAAARRTRIVTVAPTIEH